MGLRGPDYVIKFAKDNRDRPTEAEEALWEMLRLRRLRGLRFRQQHVVGRYILDFYCAEHRLAVEVDGRIHERTIEYDTVRDEYLRARGIRIIRVSNEDVLVNMADVLAQILHEAYTR